MTSYKEIKLYTFAENHPELPGFMLTSTAEGLVIEPESAHRHDYYTILFFIAGSGKHVIDFNEYTIENQSLFFILPGQMHQILLTSAPEAYIIRFTEEFLITNSIPDRLINDVYLFNSYGQSPPLHIKKKNLHAFIDIIEQIKKAERLENYTTEAVGALVKLFLILSNNFCTLQHTDNTQLLETGNRILHAFRQLINSYYTSQHKVTFYAGKLAVTADYLNKTVKAITGKPAKEHIQSKLITEAKRALVFSDITNKELAFMLGFDEPAHFNSFFKKETGLTPTEFRSNYK